jgi:hypothetical protein
LTISVGKLVRHLTLGAAQLGGENSLLCLDVVKEALTIRRVDETPERKVVSFDRITTPLLETERGGIGQPRLWVEALSNHIRDTGKLEIAQ